MKHPNHRRFLQFFPDDGVIQDAEKSFPKILWQ